MDVGKHYMRTCMIDYQFFGQWQMARNNEQWNAEDSSFLSSFVTFSGIFLSRKFLSPMALNRNGGCRVSPITTLILFQTWQWYEEALPQGDREFIVFETCLEELFRISQKRHAPCGSVSKVSGTLLKVPLCEQLPSPLEKPTNPTRQVGGHCTDGGYALHQNEPRQSAQSIQAPQREDVRSPNLLQLPARILASHNQQGEIECCILARNYSRELSCISWHRY